MPADIYGIMNRFYQSGLPSAIGSDGVALWWALVQKSNELRDPQSFTFTNTEAKERSGISHPEAFDRARKALVRAGLVEYQKGAVNTMGIYSNLDLELDPATVAARMSEDSQTTHKQLTNRSRSAHKPLTNPSQTAHESFTPDSRATHNALTRDSPDAHEPLTGEAPFVSINREEQNRTEISSREEEWAAAIWNALIVRLTQTGANAAASSCRQCRPLAVDGKTITVVLAKGQFMRDSIRSASTEINRQLALSAGFPLDVVWTEPTE